MLLIAIVFTVVHWLICGPLTPFYVQLLYWLTTMALIGFYIFHVRMFVHLDMPLVKKPMDLLLQVRVRHKIAKYGIQKVAVFVCVIFWQIIGMWNWNWKRTEMRLSLNCSQPKVEDDKGNKWIIEANCQIYCLLSSRHWKAHAGTGRKTTYIFAIYYLYQLAAECDSVGKRNSKLSNRTETRIIAHKLHYFSSDKCAFSFQLWFLVFIDDEGWTIGFYCYCLN